MNARAGGSSVTAALAAGTLVVACSTRDVVSVRVEAVEVDPGSAMTVGETRQLTARAWGPQGEVLPERVVTWTSADPEILVVSPGGQATALAAGTAEVRATALGVTGTASIVVEGAPAFAISVESVAFASTSGGSAEPVQVKITNGGGGELSGLSASVGYGSGGPTGWLGLSLAATSAPTVLTLTPASAGLPDGVHSAFVSLRSPVVPTGAHEIPVTLTVSDDSPILRVVPAAIGFAAVQAGGAPPPQTVSIQNVGHGELVGLTHSVTYSGEGGWLTATLAGSAAPTELRLVADHGGMGPGSYQAQVVISSPGAVNSPRVVAVGLTVEARAEADLAVVKEGQSVAVVGDTVRFVLTVANEGPRDAAAVTLTDSLPPGLRFVGASGGGSFDGNAVVWTLGTMPVGATVVDTVTVAADSLGVHVNIARVRSSTADPEPSNDRTEFELPVEAPTADLGLTKSGPVKASPGDTVVYVLATTNRGPGDAEEVAVTDSLPGGLTILTVSGTGTQDGRAVTWTQDRLPAGGTRADTLWVRVDGPGEFTDIARVGSATSDPLPHDNRTELTTVVESLERPELTLGKSGPDAAHDGDTLVYVLTLGNDGTGAASGVILTDSLPANVAFVAASTGGTHAAGVVTWEKGTVDAGSTSADTVWARAEGSGKVVNVARVGDSLRAEVTTLIADADLSVEMTGPETAGWLEPITWTLTVTNDGPGRARDFVLVDSLPAGIILDSVNPGATVSGREITWRRPALWPGQTFTVMVTGRAWLAGSYTNVGRARSSTGDPDADDLRATHTTTVGGGGP